MNKLASTVLHEARHRRAQTIFFFSLSILVLTVALLSEGRARGAPAFRANGVVDNIRFILSGKRQPPRCLSGEARDPAERERWR
jgi:hypothetical protein